jgi:hypothetical protein
MSICEPGFITGQYGREIGIFRLSAKASHIEFEENLPNGTGADTR